MRHFSEVREAERSDIPFPRVRHVLVPFSVPGQGLGVAYAFLLYKRAGNTCIVGMPGPGTIDELNKPRFFGCSEIRNRGNPRNLGPVPDRALDICDAMDYETYRWHM